MSGFKNSVLKYGISSKKEYCVDYSKIHEWLQLILNIIFFALPCLFSCTNPKTILWIQNFSFQDSVLLFFVQSWRDYIRLSK